MKLNLLSAIVISSVLFSPAYAADAGKDKTSSCVSCHGLNGVSNNPKIPNIAGQKKDYLIKSLKDYRGKKRNDAMMNMLTASLSDTDIEEIAAFYSAK